MIHNPRDRIRELRRVPARDLVPNPKNWRTHPGEQKRALEGLLAEIGYADALIAYELSDGRLMLIDGHLRAETTPDTVVPVLVLDVDEAEAAKILATLDPLAAMAQADDQKMTDLLAGLDTKDEAVDALLAQLAKEHEVPSEPTQMKTLETKPPPRMAWSLVGIPLTRFGEIAADMERLGKVPGIILEMTVNDHDPEKEASDGEPNRQSPATSEAGPAQTVPPKVSRRRKR